VYGIVGESLRLSAVSIANQTLLTYRVKREPHRVSYRLLHVDLGNAICRVHDLLYSKRMGHMLGRQLERLNYAAKR
jgi:hypothetical protein